MHDSISITFIEFRSRVGSLRIHESKSVWKGFEYEINSSVKNRVDK